jgi:predicted nucleic acid-binding protein
MEIKVADASAVAAVLFVEPDADEVAKRFAGATLVAPALLPLELANVCLKKMRRDSTQRAEVLNAFSMFDRLRIELFEVDAVETLILAQAARLTIYDGCYLWLAKQLHVELVTLDRALARAAASP